MKNAIALLTFVSTLSTKVEDPTVASRKVIIDAVLAEGNPEKWAYPILIPSNRGLDRGTYNLELCKAFIEEKMGATPAVKPAKKSVAKGKAAKPAKAKAVEATDEDESDEDVFEDVIAEDEAEVAMNWAPIAPGDDDISEELGLMDTYL